MYAAGAPAMIGEQNTRLMENMISPAPGNWEKRPPIKEDPSADTALTSVLAYALWHDNANQAERLIAFQKNGANFDLRVKGTSGDLYAAAVTGTNMVGGVTSYANYRGVIYYCISSEENTTTSVPAGVFSYNGTAVRTNPFGGETIFSRTVTPFVDRIILGYVRSSVTNRLMTDGAYDATGWAATNVTAENITNGSTITSRITPTNTTTARIQKAGVYTVAASTTDTVLNFRSDFRNTSPSYEMPLTTEIYYSQEWAAATAYAVGAIRIATSGAAAGAQLLRFRCTVAGTSAAAEPVWPTAVGGTVADGTVTWIADGKKELASQPFTLPTATAEEGFVTTWCAGAVPPNPAATQVGVRIKFGTEAVSTFELHAVEISLKDGKTDGDPNKANKGQQLTVGNFFYPFFNQQSSETATVDLDNDLYWTETSDPNTIRGSNFFRLRDLPGKVTAAAVVGGRLVVFKRRGMWVFQGSADPDNPLTREEFIGDVGCVGPTAVTVFEDRLYFAGDDEIYEWSPGGAPKPLCGDGMRTEVVQTTLADYPSLAVNPVRRDLYVQATSNAPTIATRNIYVYQIDHKEWSKFTFTGPGGILGGPSFGVFIWNPNTKKIYVPAKPNSTSTLGAAYFDPSAATADGFSMVESPAYVTFRPIETFFPRQEFSVDTVGVYHSVTGSQASATFEVQVSLDGGSTFPKYNRVTLPTVASSAIATRTPVPVRQLGQNLVVRLYHTGGAGSTMFNVNAVDADVRVVGPQRTISTPTQGAASL